MNQFLSRLHTDRSVIVLPEFEIVVAGQMDAQQLERQAQPVPPNNVVLTTSVCSSNDSRHSKILSILPSSIAFKEI